MAFKLLINLAEEILFWAHHILYSGRRFNLRRRRRLVAHSIVNPKYNVEVIWAEK